MTYNEEEITAAFRIFDTDCSGSITKEELSKVFQEIGMDDIEGNIKVS